MRIIKTQEELAELVENNLNDEYLCLNDTKVIGVTISPDDLKEGGMITNMSHGYFEDVVFKGIHLVSVDCYNAEFTNVKFEDCIFNVSLIKCTLKDTTFKNCIIGATRFDMCDFDESYFQYCKFTSNPYRTAQFTDSVIQLYHREDINPFPVFFYKCYFWISILVRNCQLYTNTAKFGLVSCVEDLKKILWINVTCDKYFAGSDIGKFVTVGPIGRRRGYTTYIPIIDWVQCGCWQVDEDSQESGGSLEVFENRVNDVYPKGKYHDEYMNAIQLFKTIKAQYLKKLMIK